MNTYIPIPLSTDIYNHIFQFNRRLLVMGFRLVSVDNQKLRMVWEKDNTYRITNDKNGIQTYTWNNGKTRITNYRNLIYHCSHEDFLLYLLSSKV